MRIHTCTSTYTFITCTPVLMCVCVCFLCVCLCVFVSVCVGLHLLHGFACVSVLFSLHVVICIYMYIHVLCKNTSRMQTHFLFKDFHNVLYVIYTSSCPVQSYYEQALERCKQEAIQDETYYNGLAVTTSYNMGRLHEALSQFETAENFYKIILKVKAYSPLYDICSCIYKCLSYVHVVIIPS